MKGSLSTKLIDKLLQNPEGLSLVGLDNLLKVGIPFNAPHGFKLKEITRERVSIFLPYRRLNLNHIGGIHACALATLGEFCAGMTLAKNLGLTNYRLIMSELQAHYHYQAKQNVVGKCEVLEENIERLKNEVEANNKSMILLTTEIHDDDHHVATITTHWQLKKWSEVKTQVERKK